MRRGRCTPIKLAVEVIDVAVVSSSSKVGNTLRGLSRCRGVQYSEGSGSCTSFPKVYALLFAVDTSSLGSGCCCGKTFDVAGVFVCG
jgi:hypothetical protein